MLSMTGITKRFPGVVALREVSLELGSGEVLALMGENGAGKSTLMKILGGAIQPDAGQIKLNGEPAELGSIAEAKRLGIALIHQELMLAPNLDIAGNIFLGAERKDQGGGLLARVPRTSLRRRAAALLDRVGLRLSPETPVSQLTAGQMQMVEIAKALSAEARIIIMDEPTSSLTLGETRQLFRIIADLRAAGIGIIYISHRMEEVLGISDRIAVLRDGRNVGSLAASQATHDKIVSMMVGRALSAWFPERAPAVDAPPTLEVSRLVVPGAPDGVSFTARAGEVLGFAGLVGSGRTELMEVIFGAAAALGGSMTLDGQTYLPGKAREAIERGVYLVPEDRKRHGLVLPMTIAQNISLPDIANYQPRWRLARKTEAAVATREMRRMRIKAPGISQTVVNLSGGNQQKVVLAKWLAMKPRVLILDEPTRGIDVGAKAEIYRHIADLAAQGITILMVSSDMEEILGMSDRIAVMHERRIVGILPRGDANQDRIGTMMAGKME